MNWAGLVLYTKGAGHPILVALSDPFPAHNPKIVVAVARACDEWDDEDIVVPPEDIPFGKAGRALRIEQTIVELADPVKIEDRIDPRIHNRLSIAGRLDSLPLSRLQVPFRNRRT